MKISTGRWVSGEDFFDREQDLRILKQRVQDHNHILLTGQRRMGKTSITQELGRQLQEDGWAYLFCDVEGAKCPEDVISELAYSARIARVSMKYVTDKLGRWVKKNIDEVDVLKFRLRFRAGIDSGNWKQVGRALLRDCAKNKKPVLIVIDELPIFLKRMLDQDQKAERVDEFLSWLRGEFQQFSEKGPTLIVSGSIGLEPLVRRLDISDRVNYFHPYRLGPWDKDTCIRCIERLAESYQLSIGSGVAESVYETLGIGVPHHVQSFFAHLHDFSRMHQLDQITVEHVNNVYHAELLGPSGQIHFDHYRSRLKDALVEKTYTIAETILAEAAIEDSFTSNARTILEQEYGRIMDDAPDCIDEVLDVLTHDGYLVLDDDCYRFSFRLLKDWWAASFRQNYVPIRERKN